MRKIIALGLAGALAAASVATTTATAEARISNGTAAVAGGIFGFALGALATRNYQPQTYSYYYPGYSTYSYYPGYPAYPPGTTTTYSYAAPSPYAHVAWCKANYRSYNEATDLFLGYDGYYHYCVTPSG